MGVGVYETGHDDSSGCIDSSLSAIFREHFLSCAYRDNSIRSHGYRAVWNDPRCGVHRDHDAAANEQIDSFGSARPGKLG